VVRSGPGVAAEYIDIGLNSLPQKSGSARFCLSQLDTVVSHNQVRGVLAALLYGFDKSVLFLGPKATCNRIDLEELETIIPAQFDQGIPPGFFFLRRAAEPVRPHPYPETAAE
jgi:hypothetical protein